MDKAYIKYFSQSLNYFWRWEADGTVISLSGGNTIAYREQVIQVLEALQLQGLPPFGALLLGLSATSLSGEDLIAYLQLHPPVPKEQKPDENHMQYHEVMLHEAVAFLELLVSMPAAYKKGAKKILLLQTIFEKSHNGLNRSQSEAWLTKFKEDIATLPAGENVIFKHFLPGTKGIFNRDFGCLALLKRTFPDQQSLLNAMSGLPDVKPEEVPDIPGALDKSNWLDLLLENPETFPVAALIKHIWSGLQIPFHHHLTGIQPLGGFADITNKGDVSRLLVSEYANDDLVFLSRLANNEALYLEREIPPATDKQERIILLDVSLKNWGTPRLLAYALGIAISKHPKTDMDCTLYAIGEGCSQVVTGSVDQVITSLQYLDAGLHAGEGLTVFFDQLYQKPGTEVILISTSGALAHPAVKVALRAYEQQITYRLLVTGEGAVDVWKRLPNSQKLLQQFQIPLDRLWAERKIQQVEVQPEQKRRKQKPVEWPKYPLLFPAPRCVKKTFVTEEGQIYVLSYGRRLFSVTASASRRMAVLVPEPLELPVGALAYELGKAADGHYYLIMYNGGKKLLQAINLETRQLSEIPFRLVNPDALFFARGACYYVTHSSSCKIELYPGLKITEHKRYYYSEWQDLLDTRREEIRKSKGYPGNNVVTRLKGVYITKSGYLGINKHLLKLTGIDTLIFEYERNDERETGIAIRATHNNQERRYEFANGYSVKVDPSGMFILETGRPNESPVYIPAVFDSQLAMSTRNFYTGNELYMADDPDNKKLKKIKPAEFYAAFIETFIKAIKAYDGVNH